MKVSAITSLTPAREMAELARGATYLVTVPANIDPHEIERIARNLDKMLGHLDIKCLVATEDMRFYEIVEPYEADEGGGWLGWLRGLFGGGR